MRLMQPIRFATVIAALALPGMLSAQVVFKQNTAPPPAALNTLNVAPQVPVSVSVNGQGGVRWGPNLCAPATGQQSALCNKTAAANAQILFMADPRPGQVFKGWAGACAGQGPRCFLTPTKAFAVSATFGTPEQKPMVTIKVEIPVGGGTVKPSTFAQGTINCTHDTKGYSGGTCEMAVPVGTQVALTATPQAPATFDGWSSSQAGCNGGSCTFEAKNPVVLTAKFIDPGKAHKLTVIYTRGLVGAYWLQTNPKLEWDCTPKAGPNGLPAGVTGNQTWTATCVASTPAGVNVTLMANAVGGIGAGYSIPVKQGGWGGECAATIGTTCTLAMSADRTVLVNVAANIK